MSSTTQAPEVKKRKLQQLVKIVPVAEAEEPEDDDTPIVIKKP